MRSCVSSCPSSMRSSPSHSGVLSQKGVLSAAGTVGGIYCGNGNTSSMEELQSAIQGAIAHCRNSLIQNKIVALDAETRPITPNPINQQMEKRNSIPRTPQSAPSKRLKE